MDSNSRERDLVLAPNEFAFISDQTKGHIIAYVGPYKTSMANTDKPVHFDRSRKQFLICSLEDATQTFTTAPEGWYVELKNPPADGKQPKTGTSNNSPELEIGRKVNIPGPVFFALWPGQMARINQGHHLRSNQYLSVRVYDEDQARKFWKKAVIKTKTDHEEEILEADPDLTMGRQLIIKGTEVSFYIPPTGVEVVRDAAGRYVRDAVTLELLEYCILRDENGNKRYIKGPAVVFPEPTETFLSKNGRRKFKAVELNENSGIYIKVIAPYEEGKKKFKIGEELFVTGKEQMIYFPQPEHAVIKYGEHEIYHAVAIPPGEGRYYLNKTTGKISLQTGPCMFLPDPREFVIVSRVLSSKQVQLWFPGNSEALEFNLNLQRKAAEEQTQDYVQQAILPPEKKLSRSAAMPEAEMEEPATEGFISDEFSRNTTFTPPRTVTINEKYAGAVTLGIWTGYAALVVAKTGERKVIVGPQTYLLAYDETLQGVELSTGKPKSDENVYRTVYLRVLNNKVSDIAEVETADFCRVRLSLSYRVHFSGEPLKWFEVENYVKFLTDHLRSVLRNALKAYKISDFHTDGIGTVRDIILGKPGENGKRPGRLFEENGMNVYDVEVLEISILDEDVAELLTSFRHNEIKQSVELDVRRRQLDFTEKAEEIKRKISLAESLTKQEDADLKLAEIKKELEVRLSETEADFLTERKQYEGQLESESLLNKINTSELERAKATADLEIERAQRLLAQKIEELQADTAAVTDKAKAVSPDLVAALQAFSDRALAEKMAETMAPLSIIGGKSIAEVFGKLLKGTALENVLLPVKKEEE